MSDEKRMTTDREALLRASENLGYKMAREVFDELDATRAELAELVAALPRCDICDSAATCVSGTHGHDDGERECDNHGATENERFYDLPYAPLLRRLAERSKR